MLFPFIKYVQPTWYFNLIGDNAKTPYWVNVDALSPEVQELVDSTELYSTNEITSLDAAYQLWHKGYISKNESERLETGNLSPSVADNYIFLRRYYHPIWSGYTLLIRLLSLKNPIREISGFHKSRRAKRVNLYQKVYNHTKEYSVFSSNLLASSPLVTVVIPTLNRYEYLKDAIADSINQTYSNIEVIVIDQSQPFNQEFYKQFDGDIKVVYQEEKALWLARNKAIEMAKGEYVLLFDDDSRVEPNWVEEHIKALDYFDADISSGVSLSPSDKSIPHRYSFFTWSDQIDTGNVLMKKAIFREIGLFDRQFEKQRMGDGEYGLRALLAGYKNISNPNAHRIHLKVGVGGLRQMGSWDGFRPKKFFGLRPIPSVLYYFRKYHGNKRTILTLLKNVPPSVVPYKWKRNRTALIIGNIGVLILSPIILIKVIQSWQQASKKLEEGPIIPGLK